HLAVAQRPPVDARLDLGGANSLHAVGAFFHHAPLPDRDFGIVHHLECLWLVRNVVSEIVEAPDLVGAVIGAEPRADAAVVDHLVEPIRAVHGGVDRANVFAGRHLAVLAEHRLRQVLRLLALPQVVAIDPQPVHGPVFAAVGLADHGNVVFRLAGDDACRAADAGGQVDDHSPL